MSDKELKSQLAKQCFDTGKSPIFIVDFNPQETPLIARREAGADNVKVGDRIWVNSQIRHCGSNEIIDGGTVVPSVIAVSHNDGVFVVDVCCLDNHLFIESSDGRLITP